MCDLKLTELFSRPDDKLKQYAEAVRMRIELKIGELFPNKNSSYTSIIVSEFLRAAKHYAHIYCGGLNGYVYQLRQGDFEAAINRGVNVQVITQDSFERLGSPTLAAYLRDRGRLRQARQQETIPHFIDVDGIMFRLETDANEKTAIVCAYAQSDEKNMNVINNLQNIFGKMWKMAA